jgi:DNA polymerase IIIc chi subunit
MEWTEIVNHFAVADAGIKRPIFCGHEENEDLLEEKLWQYAEGHMDESRQTVFWKK